jgi:hypothetical protein
MPHPPPPPDTYPRIMKSHMTWRKFQFMAHTPTHSAIGNCILICRHFTDRLQHASFYSTKRNLFGGRLKLHSSVLFWMPLATVLYYFFFALDLIQRVLRLKKSYDLKNHYLWRPDHRSGTYRSIASNRSSVRPFLPEAKGAPILLNVAAFKTFKTKKNTIDEIEDKAVVDSSGSRLGLMAGAF